MLKSKKLLALILAGVMTLSMGMTALAEGTFPNDSTVSGDGENVDLDTRVLQVTLPTSSALNFKIDPKGILGVEADTSATLAELDEYAGKIKFVDYVPVVLNESSVPVTLSVTLSVTGSLAATDLATTAEATQTGTDPKLYIGVKAATATLNNTTMATDDFEGTMELALSKTEVTPKFVIDEADYKVVDTSGSKTFVLTADSGNGTALLFDGACNKVADYSDFKVSGGSAATESVYTYDLSEVATKLGTGETLTVAGITVTEGADSVTAANAAEKLTEALNAASTGAAASFTWELDGTDLVATAKTAGAPGESGPDALGKSGGNMGTAAGGAVEITPTAVEGDEEVAAAATKTVGVSAVFSVDEASAADLALPDVDGAYGLKEVTGVTWTSPVPETPPTGFQSATYNMTEGTLAYVDFPLDAGITISQVMGGTYKLKLNEHYAVGTGTNAGKIGFKLSAGEWVVVITLSDGSTSTATITVS